MLVNLLPISFTTHSAASFCAVLFAFTVSIPAQQRTAELRIRILNARTNQPIADERLNVALAADQIGSVAMPTDKTGTILVTPGTHTTLRILSNMYADCRSRAELYTNYSISTIQSPTRLLAPDQIGPHQQTTPKIQL